MAPEAQVIFTRRKLNQADPHGRNDAVMLTAKLQFQHRPSDISMEIHYTAEKRSPDFLSREEIENIGNICKRVIYRYAQILDLMQEQSPNTIDQLRKNAEITEAQKESLILMIDAKPDARILLFKLQEEFRGKIIQTSRQSTMQLREFSMGESRETIWSTR